MRIALTVDNPYRDLPGLVLVALHLCQQGYTCFLVPSALCKREVLTLSPEFVVLHNLRTDKEAFARHLMSVGIGLGVLDTEGGVFRGMEQYAETITLDPAIRNAVSCFCSWGPKLARHAVETGWYRESQIHVTGTPRLDFYTAPWKDAALGMPWVSEISTEPMVLINSNFSLANPLHRTAEEAAAIKTRRWRFDPERVARLLEAERRAMSQMVMLANHLAAALPDVEFVYRPHPFEEARTYEPLLAPRPNLRLVKSGTVDGWILRARAVIQRGCSTAIEAGIAGVPALSPGWIPAPVDFETVDAVSVFCRSEEEMIEQIRGAVNGGARPSPAIAQNLHRVLEDWFLQIDGKAHQRVAAAVMAAAADRPRTDARRCLDELDGVLQPHALFTTRTRAKIRRAFGLSFDWSFRHWKENVNLSWDQDQRSYNAASVRKLVDVIQPVARKSPQREWTEVLVDSSRVHGDYHFGYKHGRSVTLFPLGS